MTLAWIWLAYGEALFALTIFALAALNQQHVQEPAVDDFGSHKSEG